MSSQVKELERKEKKLYFSHWLGVLVMTGVFVLEMLFTFNQNYKYDDDYLYGILILSFANFLGIVIMMILFDKHFGDLSKDLAFSNFVNVLFASFVFMFFQVLDEVYLLIFGGLLFLSVGLLIAKVHADKYKIDAPMPSWIAFSSFFLQVAIMSFAFYQTCPFVG